MLKMESDFRECFEELEKDEQRALVDWVRRCLAPGRPTLTSYGLKHCASNDLGFYIHNDQMKRAMELAGLAIEDKTKLNWTPKRLRHYGRPILEGSFLAWLTKRIDRDTFLGDFAREAIRDKNFPEEGSYQTFRDYFLPRHIGNNRARNAFNRAWRGYQKERGQTDANQGTATAIGKSGSCIRGTDARNCRQVEGGAGAAAQ